MANRFSVALISLYLIKFPFERIFFKKEKEIPGGGEEGGCGVRPLKK